LIIIIIITADSIDLNHIRANISDNKQLTSQSIREYYYNFSLVTARLNRQQLSGYDCWKYERCTPLYSTSRRYTEIVDWPGKCLWQMMINKIVCVPDGRHGKGPFRNLEITDNTAIRW